MLFRSIAFQFRGVLRPTILADTFACCFEGKPGGFAMSLQCRFHPGDAAEMGSDFNLAIRRTGLTMAVRGEGTVLHGAPDASFFIRFPAGRGGETRIVVDSAFREGPLAGLRAHEEKLDSVGA